MAILESLRRRAGIFLALIIGLSLFGFVLQDLFTGKGSFRTGKRFEIGVIDGKSVSYQNYQAKIDQLVEIYKIAGNASIDQQTQESINEQSWQDMIRENILDNKYQKLGIEVSSDELFSLVQGPEPHPMITQLFTDPQTGIFNRAALLSFLKNRDQDQTGAQNTYWLFLENEIYKERMFTKYTDLISKGLFVTTPQAENNMAQRLKKVDFEFIFKRYTSIPDSLITVSKSELEQYYNEHKENYKQTASRDVEYVAFDIQASPTDIKMAEDRIQKLKIDLEQTTDVAQFVSLNSDVPYDEKNYKNGELPETINNFMFSAKPGDVYGPYFENGAYKLARLVAIVNIPDSVKARHILIQPSQTKAPEIAKNLAKNLADSLKTLIDKGADFATLARLYSADKGSAQLGGNLGWFREGTMVKEFNNACFNNKKGDVVMAETQFGYHIINIQDVGAPVKKVKVAIVVNDLTPSNQTYQNIYAEASRFAGTNNTYDKFNRAIEEKGLSKRVASDIQENAKAIPGLENPRPFIRAIFKTGNHKIILDANDQASFELGDRFIIGYVTGIREEGYAPLEQVKADVEISVVKEKKAQMIVDEIHKDRKDASSLVSLAEKMSLNVELASGISFSSFSVPLAGIEPALIAAAVAVPQNTLSEPIKGNNGVYVINVTAVNEEPATDMAIEKQRLNGSFEARAGYEAYEALKKKADIKDERSKFF